MHLHPEPGWQLLSPHLPSLDLRSLSGPVSHGGRDVCALRGGMGGPPLTLWLAQKIPKKGVVCIEGTKALSSPPPHTHTINMLLCVYALAPLWGSNHLWLLENLDVRSEKLWARLNQGLELW